MAETDPTTTPREEPVRRASVRALALLGLVAVLAWSIDQITKIVVVDSLPMGRSVPFLGELLQLTYVLNPGAAFSLGEGTTWIFAIIASAVVVFLLVFARRIRSIAWAVVFGLLLGGTLGNLTDRLFREPGFGVGHVVDFLHVWGFPAIFNIADVCIVSAMGLFIILTLRGIGLDGRRQAETKAAAAEAE